MPTLQGTNHSETGFLGEWRIAEQQMGEDAGLCVCALAQGVDMRGDVLLHVPREQQRGSLQLLDGVVDATGHCPDNAVGSDVPLVGFAGKFQCTDGARLDLQTSPREALAIHCGSLEQRYSFVSPCTFAFRCD